MNKKVLWLEDQYEDLSDFLTPVSRGGYSVDPVDSVVEAITKLRRKKYFGVIFDIKVHPGQNSRWSRLEKRKRREHPGFDPYLGLELLRSIYNPGHAEIKLVSPIDLDPKRVIVFTVVDPNEIAGELVTFGIPKNQIRLKAAGDLAILRKLLDRLPRL